MSNQNIKYKTRKTYTMEIMNLLRRSPLSKNNINVKNIFYNIIKYNISRKDHRIIVNNNKIRTIQYTFTIK